MVRGSKALLVMGWALALMAAMNVQAAVFFVDAENGDDANSGGPSDPFATIQQGVDAAAESAGPDTVIIRAGEYSENVAIDDADRLSLAGGEAEVSAADGESPTIAISSGAVSIQGLSITGGDPGIEAIPGEDASVSLALHDCRVNGNNDRGVNAEMVEFVQVVGGTYNGNDGDGIKIEEADIVHVEGAEVSGNDSDGLDLEVNGSMNLINLIVNDNGDEGIEVDDCGSAVVLACMTSDNADDGLDLDNTAEVVVIHCVSTGNGDVEEINGNGLQVEADDEDFPVDSVMVVDSVFSENAENGIHVVEDGVVVGFVALTGITAQDNQLSGVRLEVTGDVRVNRIVSSGNGEADVLP